MTQSNEVVDLWKYISEWSRCITAHYQLDHWYRTGELDSCANQYADLKLSFKAKVAKTPEEATEIVKESYYLKNLGSDPKNSPTCGIIWEAKKNPSWEVEVDEKN